MDKNSLYENSRSFDAYYYSFSPIGEYRFDVILHAVAKAGKAYHGTEDWGNETAPYTEHLSGESPVDWIWNAVASANGEFQEVKRQRDSLLEALRDMVSDHACLSGATLEFARAALAAAEG